MKTCRKCKEEKPESEYYRYGGAYRPNRIRDECKTCSKAMAMAHQKANPALYKRTHRRYYLSHGNERRAYQNEYNRQRREARDAEAER